MRQEPKKGGKRDVASGGNLEDLPLEFEVVVTGAASGWEQRGI
jgi:hypothetical protein